MQDAPGAQFVERPPRARQGVAHGGGLANDDGCGCGSCGCCVPRAAAATTTDAAAAAGAVLVDRLLLRLHHGRPLQNVAEVNSTELSFLNFLTIVFSLFSDPAAARAT